MSKLVVGGVRLDGLLAMEPGKVINAVPESERSYYQYWRGVHLGKIALNLLRGRMVINAGETDKLIFFSDNYDDGPRIADRISSPGATCSQWSEADAQQFAELTGVPAPDHFGAAVIAARYVGNWPTSKYDPGWGNSVEAYVGFHEIDPYSREALENLFEVDLLNQPESVGIDSPLSPRPVRDAIVSPSLGRPYEDSYYMPGQRPFSAV